MNLFFALASVAVATVLQKSCFKNSDCSPSAYCAFPVMFPNCEIQTLKFNHRSDWRLWKRWFGRNVFRSTANLSPKLRTSLWMQRADLQQRVSRCERRCQRRLCRHVHGHDVVLKQHRLSESAISCVLFETNRKLQCTVREPRV
jgi:hypothetical protein